MFFQTLLQSAELIYPGKKKKKKKSGVIMVSACFMELSLSVSPMKFIISFFSLVSWYPVI